MSSPGRSAPLSPVAAAEARAHMVEHQLRRRGVGGERVLEAMGRVPRELFLPEDLRRFAYEDGAFPIGFGQTISQPFIVGTICQLLALEGGERVLDVGTGSGYQAAVLAELAAEVVTIERVLELATRAEAALAESGLERVEVRNDRPSTRSPSPPRRPGSRPLSTSSFPSAAGSCFRGARAGARSSCSSRSRRTGPSSARRCRVGSCPSSAPRGSGVADPIGGRSDRAPDYPATAVDSSAAEPGFSRARVGAALRRRRNWEQLVKFCIVGASGYVVNLAVFALAFHALGLHYLVAAVCSFLVAVTNNYSWNRLWTFRAQRGHVAYQGMRFFVVSTLALVANLVVLYLLVTAGMDEVLAQAVAIVLVTPVNFVGNKLWSFGPRR